MMVDRDLDMVSKEKQANINKRKERNLTANFNLENYYKQTMVKKMEREAEKRKFNFNRSSYNRSN